MMAIPTRVIEVAAELRRNKPSDNHRLSDNSERSETPSPDERNQ